VNSEVLSSILHSLSASSVLVLFRECACTGSLVFPGSLQVSGPLIQQFFVAEIEDNCLSSSYRLSSSFVF